MNSESVTRRRFTYKQVELPSGSAPNDERKKSMLASLEREIALLKDLHHENIVQYHCKPPHSPSSSAQHRR